MPHIHEKIDYCAETFVVFKNKVLLRKHDKYKIWNSVGGHIELDENPNEAAIREVKEEVGLDVELYEEEGKQPRFSDGGDSSLIPPQFLNLHPTPHPTTKDHIHIAFVFFARSKNDKLKLSETEVTDECHWFTKEELLKNEQGITGKVQFYALKALEKLS